MTTRGAGQLNERTRKYILPPDLSTWIDKRNLAMLVSRIVQRVDDSKLQAAGSTAGGGSPQPRTMLTLLTFCYAAGIFGSQKIRRCCDEDKIIGYLCANHPPESALICQFRRLHRQIIEQCLEKVFLVVWKTRVGTWHGKRLNQQSNSTSAAGCRIDPLFQKQIAFEVTDRLDKAERLDAGKFDVGANDYPPSCGNQSWILGLEPA
jgi:transposase